MRLLYKSLPFIRDESHPKAQTAAIFLTSFSFRSYLSPQNHNLYYSSDFLDAFDIITSVSSFKYITHLRLINVDDCEIEKILTLGGGGGNDEDEPLRLENDCERNDDENDEDAGTTMWKRNSSLCTNSSSSCLRLQSLHIGNSSSTTFSSRFPAILKNFAMRQKRELNVRVCTLNELAGGPASQLENICSFEAALSLLHSDLFSLEFHASCAKILTRHVRVIGKSSSFPPARRSSSSSSSSSATMNFAPRLCELVFQNLSVIAKEKPTITIEYLTERLRLLKTKHTSSGEFIGAVKQLQQFDLKHPFEFFLELFRVGFRTYNWDLLPVTNFASTSVGTRWGMLTNNNSNNDDSDSDNDDLSEDNQTDFNRQRVALANENYESVINRLFVGFKLTLEDRESPPEVVISILDFLSRFIEGRDDVCRLILEHVDPKLGIIKILKQIIQDTFLSKDIINEMLHAVKYLSPGEYSCSIQELEWGPQNLKIDVHCNTFQCGVSALSCLTKLCLPIEPKWSAMLFKDHLVMKEVAVPTLFAIQYLTTTCMKAEMTERPAARDQYSLNKNVREALEALSKQSGLTNALVLSTKFIVRLSEDLSRLFFSSSRGLVPDELFECEVSISSSSCSQSESNPTSATVPTKVPFLSQFSRISLDAFHMLERTTQILPPCAHTGANRDMFDGFTSFLFDQLTRHSFEPEQDMEPDKMLERVNFLSLPLSDGGCDLLSSVFEFADKFLKMKEKETSNAPSRTRRYADPRSLEILRSPISLVEKIITMERAAQVAKFSKNMKLIESSEQVATLSLAFDEKEMEKQIGDTFKTTVVEKLKLLKTSSSSSSAKNILQRLQQGFRRFGTDTNDIDSILSQLE